MEMHKIKQALNYEFSPLFIECGIVNLFRIKRFDEKNYLFYWCWFQEVEVPHNSENNPAFNLLSGLFERDMTGV